jgi:hypothetical protein
VNGVDTSVKVLLTSGNIVSGNWNKGSDISLGTSTIEISHRRYVPQMMGHEGRYLEQSRAVAPLVDRTMMAPASCSMEAETAAKAKVSAVSVGRGVNCLSWSKRGG